MMEFLMMVFSTYILTIWGVIGLCGLAMIWEYNDWTLSMFIGLFALGAVLMFSGYSLDSFKWYHILAYLIVGVAWSMWRFKKHVKNHRIELQRKIDEDVKRNPDVHWNKPSEDVIKDFKDNVGVYHNIDRITSWILNWPISLLENLLQDTIDFIHKVIKEHLVKMYNYFITQEANKLDLTNWDIRNASRKNAREEN